MVRCRQFVIVSVCLFGLTSCVSTTQARRTMTAGAVMQGGGIVLAGSSALSEDIPAGVAITGGVAFIVGNWMFIGGTVSAVNRLEAADRAAGIEINRVRDSTSGGGRDLEGRTDGVDQDYPTRSATAAGVGGAGPMASQGSLSPPPASGAGTIDVAPIDFSELSDASDPGVRQMYAACESGEALACGQLGIDVIEGRHGLAPDRLLGCQLLGRACGGGETVFCGMRGRECE